MASATRARKQTPPEANAEHSPLANLTRALLQTTHFPARIELVQLHLPPCRGSRMFGRALDVIAGLHVMPMLMD